MQSIGFAYAIEPVLRRFYPDPAAYELRLRLHMEYFNTQPYLASYILGAVIRIEEDRVSGLTADGDVSGLKTALMAPLGALGDSFFWGALKPLAAVVAVALLMTGYWWAPLLFLVFYNVWHVGLRAGMLFWGYQSGGDAVALMTRYSLMKTAKRFKRIALTVLGGIIGMVPDWRLEFQPTASGSFLSMALVWLAVTTALAAIFRRGGSPIQLMLGLAAFCLALAYAGVIQ
jgi:mannose/fructose/N-acetylgalactosamine-specific phosphotransferase system component IID